MPFRNEKEPIYPYNNAYDAFIAKRSQFDASACSAANIHDELIKAVHIIRSMESGEMDIAPPPPPQHQIQHTWKKTFKTLQKKNTKRL